LHGFLLRTKALGRTHSLVEGCADGLNTAAAALASSATLKQPNPQIGQRLLRIRMNALIMWVVGARPVIGVSTVHDGHARDQECDRPNASCRVPAL
jgi:hypothetical protein